ncbi:ABC transporter ATP-binding protein [Nocardia otitidiscaviarum]|uniref:ABC transporter ATP-binding protein n=1 Tax=Nocardia otitidiscaviarum TaxID=1823 RepID=UPI001E5C2C71|nr:ATP-binding cassette domain-containing protein [Nocardia otitidiscaviarum]
MPDAGPTTPPGHPAVRVRNLAVAATDGRMLLRDASLDAEPGRVVALTGLSGAGKTTLLRALTGILPPGTTRTDGTVEVLGHDVFALDTTALRELRRTRIAFVGQDPGSALNPRMRVRALVRELATDSSSVTDLLTEVRLPTDLRFTTRRPAALSGGQQRRVALARALARRPDVLLLDEPTAGLHPELRDDIADLLRTLAHTRALAIVLTCHDRALVDRIADTEVHLESGDPSVHTVTAPAEPPRPFASEAAAGDDRSRRAAAPDHSADRLPSNGLPTGPGERGPAASSTAADVATPVEQTGAAPTAATSAGSVPSAYSPVRAGEPESANSVPAGCGGFVSGRGENLPGDRVAAGAVGGRTGDANGTALVGGRVVGSQAAASDPGRLAASSHSAEVAAVTNESLLVVRGLEVSFAGSGQRVLHGVDLAVGAGRAVGIVGPSGSGKTSVARAVVGLHPPERGTVTLDGVALRGESRWRSREQRRRVQLVPQSPLGALNPSRSVGETLGRPLRLHRRCAAGERARRVAELLRQVELAPDFARRYPHELSGGQRQRVAIARALAAEPDVLICDEVTSALDDRTGAAIMDLLAGLRASHRLALVLIAHDLPLIAERTDTVTVLDAGRVVESGRTASVFAAPAHETTRALLAPDALTRAG